MARGWPLFLALIASQGWAGDGSSDESGPSTAAGKAVWVADYRIRDAHGERELVLVRDAGRVEYRVAGEPIRVWRQTPDGVELRELYPAARRMVVYAPGDLRTLDKVPDWERLSGLTDPALRMQLTTTANGKAFAQPLTRYRGVDDDGKRIELDWLAGPSLPVRYCVGEHCAERDDEDAIRLQGLTQVPAGEAFTPLDGLLEIDHADLGDMELDSFVHGLPHAGHSAH